MTLNSIYIQGDKYSVVCSKKKFIKPKVLLIGEEIHIFTAENNDKRYEDILLEWIKKQSKAYFFKRIRELAKNYGFEYNRISLRDQNTRWGSCSSLKNLNFNWRLYLAPLDVADYVIIHELAHTKQMNHSKDFWAIVEDIMPHYKLSRKWLKENGRALKMMI